MKPNEDCAAICGLFCGTCPSFIKNSCGGCLSKNCCCDCFNGFKDCASENNVTRCYDCGKFPCEKLKDFSTRHIENGICHHKNVIKDLQEMKDVGVDLWVEKQTVAHTCKKCGRLIAWNKKECDCK
ncbi:MAG: DUF3795 domain-containing protein [Clostridia bacterium]